MRKELKTGAVFELELMHNFGYALCKINNFLDFAPDGLLFKVYSTVRKTPRNQFPHSDLDEDNLLFGPQVLSGLPRSLNKVQLRYLGSHIQEDDFIVPDFKDTQHIGLFWEEATVDKWFPIVKFERKDYCSYELVKHLERPIFSSVIDINIRASMEWCRHKGLGISDYFNLDDEANKAVYIDIKHIPKYSDIPKNIRGKAIGYENIDRRMVPDPM